MDDKRNCYELTYHAISKGDYDTEEGQAILCHGYPRLTRPDGTYPEGTLYGHAWIERKEILKTPGMEPLITEISVPVCIDVCTGASVNKQLFYAIGRIDPELVSRYTWVQALAMAMERGNYGPWGNIPEGAVFSNMKGM